MEAAALRRQQADITSPQKTWSRTVISLLLRILFFTGVRLNRVMTTK
jgi:hypothetical protein